MYTRELPEQPTETLFSELAGEVYVHEIPEQPLDSPAVTAAVRLSAFAKSIDLLEATAAAEELQRNVGRGKNAGLAEGLKEQQQTHHDQAYAQFALGYGAYALVAAGQAPDAVHRDAWNDFFVFKRRFGGKDKQAERVEYKAQLALRFAGLVAMGSEPLIIEAQPAMERHTQYPTHLGVGEDRELTLTTREKLVALRDDRHARFLPTTHREKNAALALLDYEGNPDYPKGIVAQLDEIYIHQKNLPLSQSDKAKKKARAAGESFTPKSVPELIGEGTAVAEDTIRSVLHEWGDYVASAKYSISQLTDLSTLISEQDNPRLTLKMLLDEQDTTAPDVLPLLRFLDLRKFRETGELPDPLFDPLRTREIRPVVAETKNKVVTDVYMLPAGREQLDEQFNETITHLTVGELRGVMHEAVMDSSNRFLFFRGMLGKALKFDQYTEHARRAIEEIA